MTLPPPAADDELRQLAEAATQGARQPILLSDDMIRKDPNGAHYAVALETHPTGKLGKVHVVAVCGERAEDNEYDELSANDAQFFAACSPSRVLTLLDEKAALQARVERAEADSARLREILTPREYAAFAAARSTSTGDDNG